MISRSSLLLVSIFSLAIAGAAFASPVSGKGSAAEAPAAPAPVARTAYDANEAPIVSGRSVSAHRKSKMHHVRISPDQFGDGQLAEEATPGR